MGFMLGYVLAPPVENVVNTVADRIQKAYGESAALTSEAAHALSLAILEGALSQKGSHSIRLKNIFVNMTPATQPISASSINN